MTEQHPITPPQELVRQWAAEYWSKTAVAALGTTVGCQCYIATQTAKWCHEQRGAELQKARDEELEACVEWLSTATYADSLGIYTMKDVAVDLRAARRPKPPSLKEQALKALDEALFMADDNPPEGICSDQADTIRRALEAIPDE